MSQSKNNPSANKALKQNLANAKNQPKNDVFYVKKRGLFRKAEQVMRYCNSDVFILVHNKDSDKIFHYMSDKDFNLEKISSLIHRDVIHGACLHKNRKFEDVDFEKVKRNIDGIAKINSLFDPNETQPVDVIQQKNEESLMKGVPVTSLEDSESMSVQGPNTRATKRTATANQKNTQDYEGTFNALSSQDPTSPKGIKEITMPVKEAQIMRKAQMNKQQAEPQQQNFPMGSQHFQQNAYYNAERRQTQAYPKQQYQEVSGNYSGSGVKYGYNSHQQPMSPTNRTYQTTQNTTQLQSSKTSVAKHPNQQQSPMTSAVKYKAKLELKQNSGYQQTDAPMLGAFNMIGAPGRESLIRSKGSGDQASDMQSVDLNQYKVRSNAHGAVDNDDILWCADMDPNNKESYNTKSIVHDQRKIQQMRAGQSSMIQMPHQTQAASGLPGQFQPGLSQVSPFNGKQVSQKAPDKLTPSMVIGLRDIQEDQDMDDEGGRQRLLSPTSMLSSDAHGPLSPRNMINEMTVKPTYNALKHKKAQKGQKSQITNMSIEMTKNQSQRQLVQSRVLDPRAQDPNAEMRWPATSRGNQSRMFHDEQQRDLTPEQKFHQNSNFKYKRRYLGGQHVAQSPERKLAAKQGAQANNSAVKSPIHVQNINQQYQTSIYNISMNHCDAQKLQSIVAPNQENYDEYEQKDFEQEEQQSLYPEDRHAQFRTGYFQPQEHAINQRKDSSGNTSGSRPRQQIWSKTSVGRDNQNNSLMRDNDSNQLGRDPNMTMQYNQRLAEAEFAAKKTQRSPFDMVQPTGMRNNMKISKVNVSGSGDSRRSFVRSVHSGAIRQHQRSSESGNGDHTVSGQ